MSILLLTPPRATLAEEARVPLVLRFLFDYVIGVSEWNSYMEFCYDVNFAKLEDLINQNHEEWDFYPDDWDEDDWS